MTYSNISQWSKPSSTLVPYCSSVIFKWQRHTYAQTHTHTHRHTHTHYCCVFLCVCACCYLRKVWPISLADIACRACHSSGTFFSLWHTHTHTETHTHAHMYTQAHRHAQMPICHMWTHLHKCSKKRKLRRNLDCVGAASLLKYLK